MPLVVVLDDDPTIHEQLLPVLLKHGVRVESCFEVDQAIAALERQPAFFIIDLMLLGDHGAELSNGFIKSHLVPRKIPYARISSAVPLIPCHLYGVFSPLDKRRMNRDLEAYIAGVVAHIGSRDGAS